MSETLIPSMINVRAKELGAKKGETKKKGGFRVCSQTGNNRNRRKWSRARRARIALNKKGTEGSDPCCGERDKT